MNNVFLNKNIEEYCEGIQKLFFDIKKEIDDGVKDGIMIELSRQIEDSLSICSFLKKQGYEMMYKDFLSFYEEMKEYVVKNSEDFQSDFDEIKVEELNDNDLEQVAGGTMYINPNGHRNFLAASFEFIMRKI